MLIFILTRSLFFPTDFKVCESFKVANPGEQLILPVFLASADNTCVNKLFRLFGVFLFGVFLSVLFGDLTTKNPPSKTVSLFSDLFAADFDLSLAAEIII